MFKVPEQYRLRSGLLGSDETAENNGCFFLPFKKIKLKIIASDGEDWEHVSVSVFNELRTPTWDEMCFVKQTFWDEEDCVIQYHPAKSEYVNYHPYCLHLWRPMKEIIPIPKKEMVGPSMA